MLYIALQLTFCGKRLSIRSLHRHHHLRLGSNARPIILKYLSKFLSILFPLFSYSLLFGLTCWHLFLFGFSPGLIELSKKLSSPRWHSCRPLTVNCVLLSKVCHILLQLSSFLLPFLQQEGGKQHLENPQTKNCTATCKHWKMRTFICQTSTRNRYYRFIWKKILLLYCISCSPRVSLVQ